MGYRGYFWCNWYLRSIQQGIQAAHCLGEMVLKHTGPFVPDVKASSALSEWLHRDKTMIVLNGGNSDNIELIHSQLVENAPELPYAIFHEESSALKGAACSVGIVVPEYIWNHSESADIILTTGETALYELITNSKLAT